MQEGMAERIDEVVCNHALLFPAAMHLERQDDRELRCDESAFADRPCDRGECLGRAKRMAMGHDRRFDAVPAIDLNMPARLQEKAVVCVGRGPACELIADNIRIM